jgi:hypothetical protein
MAENKRGEVLQRALEACILGKTDALPEFFTPDVSVWSPNMLATSLDELTEAVADREGAFSDVTIQIDALDIVGNKGYAEYRLGATFSGPFVIDDENSIEPNGQEIVVGAALVADFEGDKISAARNYFDDLTLMAQLFAE